MTIVFKVSDNVKPKMIKYYQDLKKDKTPPYAVFQAVDADTVITLYESGKVMFQGISADIDAGIWIDQERVLNNRLIDIDGKKDKKDELKTFINENSIGSDEVGTGDYFGHVVVTASFVSKDKFNFLQDLGVRDSKKLTDEKIIKIAPEIIKQIPYTTYVFDNKTYNKLYNENTNMNKIKAILHNKVLYSMCEKEPECHCIVVDQFVYPKKYYEHINEAKNKVINIKFMTKAEDQCLSVACSSIISRYIFLKEMNKLSTELQINIPKGAGTKVDEVAKTIVTKYGLDKLTEIAKLNFKNTDKIKES